MNDTYIESQFLRRQILENFSNGIGELTTVLFRKKIFGKIVMADIESEIFSECKMIQYGTCLHFHIDSREKLLQPMDNWLKRQDLIRDHHNGFNWNEFFSQDDKIETKILKNIINSLENKNYDEAINYELEYIKKKDGIDEVLNIFQMVRR